jgi:hypothetical protein
MNAGIVRYTARIFPIALRNRNQVVSKQDYKARLWSTPVNDARCTDLDEVRSCPYADRVRIVIGNMKNGVAFQSLAVASLQTLQKVLACEKQAGKAAISLAQGQKLDRLIEEAEITAEAIVKALDSQGAHMLHLSNVEAADGGEKSWWFALTETIQAIEDGTERLLSLASGQPKGGPGRQLSSVVVRLLREQHHQLLSEADAWIS